MEDLLHEIDEAGIVFFLTDTGLKLSAPSGAVTPNMLAKLKRHKAEIETLMGRQAEGGRKLPDPEQKSIDLEPSPPPSHQSRRIPSSIALTWLVSHKAELKLTGWTSHELFRRNKSKGILWMGIWNRPDLKPQITTDGVIEFWFTEHGSAIRQTARPRLLRTSPLQTK